MTSIALVTSRTDLPNDDDMPLLVTACRKLSLSIDVCAWDDSSVDWSRFDHVIVRSTWDYTARRSEFLLWCRQLDALTTLHNPLVVARWATDKHYLADLAAIGVPVVPSRFIEPGDATTSGVHAFLADHPQAAEFVVKPTIGSYSKNVKRYRRAQVSDACIHVARILDDRCGAIIQPYFASVDRLGETDLVYFDDVYSHAIRKNALLLADGTVNGPTPDFRSLHAPADDERACALAVLEATTRHLALDRPLLYARVDLIRDENGRPQLLELDICEPSLSLPFAVDGAMRFATAIARRVTPA